MSKKKIRYLTPDDIDDDIDDIKELDNVEGIDEINNTNIDEIEDEIEDTKPKFRMNLVRDRQEKMKKVKEKIPYYASTGVDLFSTYIQNQNKDLLEQIAKDQDFTNEQTQDLINRFWQPCYWIPTPTKDINKELAPIKHNNEE